MRITDFSIISHQHFQKHLRTTRTNQESLFHVFNSLDNSARFFFIRRVDSTNNIRDIFPI